MMSVFGLGKLLFSVAVLTAVGFAVTHDSKMLGRENGTPLERTPSAPCVHDPGGGSEVTDQCFETAGGKLVLFFGSDLHDVRPAPDRYLGLIQTACEVMEIEAEDCDVLPMLAKIGHNALAGMCEGRKVILFDENIDHHFGAPGATFAILHELGHHHCGHVDQPNQPEHELVADAFAGAGLHMMGVSRSDTLSVSLFLVDRQTGSYPEMEERTVAIAKGWAEPDQAIDCKGYTGNNLTN